MYSFEKIQSYLKKNMKSILAFVAGILVLVMMYFVYEKTKEGFTSSKCLTKKEEEELRDLDNSIPKLAAIYNHAEQKRKRLIIKNSPCMPKPSRSPSTSTKPTPRSNPVKS